MTQQGPVYDELLPLPAILKKTRDRALTLAAPVTDQLGELRPGRPVGRLRQKHHRQVAAPDAVDRTPVEAIDQYANADAGAGPLSLELDGLWTRTRAGRTELKVIRDANTGIALGAFGRWAEVPGGIPN